MTSVKITDNTAIFKNAKDRAVAAALAVIGEEATWNAMEELTNKDALNIRRLPRFEWRSIRGIIELASNAGPG